MKRFVIPLVLLVALAGVATYIQQAAMRSRHPAAWLPAGTILFDDMPDFHRTAQRWPKTALAQILGEPEVKAFLEQPLGAIPGRAQFDSHLDRIRKVDPTHFFIAVTELSGSSAPKVITGFSYAGPKQDVSALIDEFRDDARQAWPAAKSDIEKYGPVEIETFATPTFTASLALRGRWVFLATDTALLKSTLDRYEGAAMRDSLGQQQEFKNCLRHLPGAADNILFIRPGLLADKAESLVTMLNPAADTHGLDQLRQIDAFGYAFKLDGQLMRDAACVIGPGAVQPGDDTPLSNDALRLSTTDTILASSTRLRPLGNVELPDPGSDPSGILAMIEEDLKAFTGKGLGAGQFGQAFGPESGFVLNWPAGALSAPTPLVLLDVRDPALAHKFADTLAGLSIAGVSLDRQDSGNLTLYSLPATGFGIIAIRPALALAPKCAIAGLDPDTLKEAASRWDAGGPNLATTTGYKSVAGLVRAPTLAFTFLDTKALFEHIYGLVSGAAMFGLVPHQSNYVDLAKLPPVQTISRHLSPLVVSESAKDGALIMESTGPVTMAQAVLATAVSAGAAAVPIIEQQLMGQSVSIPGFPSGIPAPAVPAPSPVATP